MSRNHRGRVRFTLKWSHENPNKLPTADHCPRQLSVVLGFLRYFWNIFQLGLLQGDKWCSRNSLLFIFKCYQMLMEMILVCCIQNKDKIHLWPSPKPRWVQKNRGREHFLQVNIFLDFTHERKSEWKKVIDLSRRESGEDNWYKSVSWVHLLQNWEPRNVVSIILSNISLRCTQNVKFPPTETAAGLVIGRPKFSCLHCLHPC